MNFRRPLSPPNVAHYNAVKNSIYGHITKTVYLPAKKLWKIKKDQQEKCIRIIRRFLDNYIVDQKWKRLPGCVLADQYSPVYDLVNLLLLCVEFNVDDPQLVSDLITAFYTVDQDHTAIWLGIGCRFMQEHWENCTQLFGIEQWRIQNVDNYYLLVLEYIIKYAVKAGTSHVLTLKAYGDDEARTYNLPFLDFPIHGSSRFTEESQPIVFFIKRGCPKELRLLLKYGANVPPPNISHIRSTDMILDVTLGVAFCIQILPTFLDDMKTRMIECTLLILAEVPYYSLLRIRLIEILLFWFSKEEDMQYGCQFPTLMEISRYNIRQSLRRNHQLPSGIDKLELTRIASEFLALRRLGPKGMHFRFKEK